jgi:hypothetical protein
MSTGSAEQRAATNARISAVLLAEPEPAQRDLPKLSRDEYFTLKLVRAYGEVFSCTERLRDCETYISRYPFRGTRVTRAAYLQMVVELHLHEVYILQERLMTWFKQIERAYKSDTRAAAVRDAIRSLSTEVAATLGDLVRLRGGHVHQERHDHTDIARLRLIDLLALSRDPRMKQTMRQLRKIAVTESHERLKEQARRWNTKVSVLLERVFQVMTRLLFAPITGSLLAPAPSRRKLTA